MKTRISSKNIVVGKELFSGHIYVEDGKITDLTTKLYKTDISYDFGEAFVSPGFIDIHTHGGGGFSFSNSSPEDIARAADFHLCHGTTSILPTISAAPMKDMESAVVNIKEAMERGLASARILGAHLEGPYFSPAQAGAQIPDFITPPNKDEYVPLIEKHGDAIKRISYAPEEDLGGEFAKYITAKGIIASAGHTNAKYPDMELARECGCNLVTHLYSCTSTVTRERGFRSAGVIESAYLFDDMFVEIIADGCHLPPELIKLIIKIKGQDKVAIITDSLYMTGTDGGSVTEYIIEDGVAKLPSKEAFAGSIATADRAVRTVVNCGFSVAEACYMMSAVPAEIMGLTTQGKIKVGADADLVVFDNGINIEQVFVSGEPKVKK